MRLKEFLGKNNVIIGKDCLDLCKVGIDKMKKSKDVSHTEKHVYSLLSELQMLLDNEKTLNKYNIDFEVLLPAICWHDIWRATRQLTDSLLTYMLELEYEGFGSYRIFKKHLKINHKKIKKSKLVGYSIALHPNFRFLRILNILKKRLKKESVEFQILTDIDSLDTIGMERVKQIATKYIKKGNTDPLLFRIAYHWMSHNLNWLDNYKMEFEYSREKFRDYGENVKKETVKIFLELLENKEYYFDINNPNYKLIEYFKPSKKDQVLIEKYS